MDNQPNVVSFAHQQLYHVFILGEQFQVVFTREAEVIIAWLEAAYRSYTTLPRIIGLAIQWQPRSDSPPAIIQLCIGRNCVVFQLLHASDIPLRLKTFLSDPSNIFVGNQIQLVCHKLRRHWGIVVGTALDVHDLSGRNSDSFGALAARFLGYLLPDLINRSEWHRRILTSEQIRCAAINACVAFRLGWRFLKE